MLDQSGAAAPEVGERGIWERQVRNLEALCRFGDLSCKTVRSWVHLALLAGPAIKNEKTGDGRRGVGGHTPSHHSKFPRPRVLGISRRGGPSQPSPFWELCEEIRGCTGSRLNEPSGGDNGADLTRGHRAFPPGPAQLPGSFIPCGESSGVSYGRRTNGPTRESAGRSGDSLKGSVDFNF